jgi:hypothetical protein
MSFAWTAPRIYFTIRIWHPASLIFNSGSFCHSGHQSLTEPKQAFNSCPSRVYRIHDQLRFPKLWHY